ncbi:MAG TPA: Stp1/IreP family PP2C-type Ser/Thr phosphatase [Solirubrobacteraceae bacterium]|nr:Stp1/IreP family PP2C-type Ser/Thr phosphatase [Solirubrobacteraceae bacterium]
MLRIAEHFHDSDLGRQRQGNEDNLFVRAPLFVVADGMGGAQAGEVASEIAVSQFEGGLPDDGDPARSLVELIRAANARIHEESRADAQRAGMGTTLTAAYLAEDAVVVAHVGDSRCYLLRDGDLTRLTRDHSLVDELVRRGKLTEAQAEAHPQRSVITRALGAGADVEVDVEVFPARDGDLFLVCSDGLTGMVHEAQLKPLLEQSGSLDRMGRSLIAAANEAGGRDNITVILFRLEDAGRRTDAGSGAAATVESEAVATGGAETTEYDTFAGEAVPPRQGVSRPSAAASDETEAEYRRTGTVALQAIPAAEGGATAPAREPPPPRTAPLPGSGRPRRRRRPGGGTMLLLLGLVLPLLIGAWLATRAVYFVGTDPGDGRTVAIFRGLPYELPFGVDLYERWYASGVTLEQVPQTRRATFTDHQLRSRDDAEDLVRALERGTLE